MHWFRTRIKPNRNEKLKDTFSDPLSGSRIFIAVESSDVNKYIHPKAKLKTKNLPSTGANVKTFYHQNQDNSQRDNDQEKDQGLKL